jgi:hypothetical protein
MSALARPILVLLAATAACARAPRAATATATTAAGATPPEISAIDKACDAAVKLDAARKERARFLADVSESVRPEANDGSGRWLLFGSDAELKDYAKKNGAPNTQAHTWTAPDGTFVASIFFQSDSGDWSHDVDYCFRPDGTLARSDAVIVNYADESDAGGQRVVHYAANGRVLLSTARRVDDAGKSHPADDLDAPPVYPTVRSLPFNAPARAGPKGSPPGQNVDPELDPAVVAKTVKANLGPVHRCYDDEVAKNPNLNGKLIVRWKIERDGTTKDVSAETDTVADPTLTGCVLDLVRTWRFPPPAGGTITVSFPFVFQPAGPPVHR